MWIIASQLHFHASLEGKTLEEKLCHNRKTVMGFNHFSQKGSNEYSYSPSHWQLMTNMGLEIINALVTGWWKRLTLNIHSGLQSIHFSMSNIIFNCLFRDWISHFYLPKLTQINGYLGGRLMDTCACIQFNLWWGMSQKPSTNSQQLVTSKSWRIK